MIEAMWKSVCNHIQDIHEEHSDLYPACAYGPLDEEERDKEWLQPRRKFGFLFYKKSLLLVPYFFISNLICSIKGLWKADRHQRWEDCKLLVGPVPHPYSGGILSLIAMAFFTLRLMVLFSSNRTFTLRGLMLWPVAWQCSKMAEYQGTGVLWSGDKERDLAVWPMNVIVRATPSSAEWRKPLPLNKNPLLNRYEGLAYQQFSTDLRVKKSQSDILP